MNHSGWNLRIAFFFIAILFLALYAFPKTVLQESYYTLIKQAVDILIIRVDRIQGEKFSEKAIAHVERSLKGKIQQDSIDLPFIYKSFPIGNGNMEGVGDIVPVSFEVGKEYVVLLRKSDTIPFGHQKIAKTEYQVMQYFHRTFFEISDTTDHRLSEIEQMINITNEHNIINEAKSLLPFLSSDSSYLRLDAVEALVDLRYEGATDQL
ncbi:MAG TPA: hypothetical protein VKI62_03830, partial [Bacteroidota bacterium]|nr:hypothetical protein [Bacteroidota bacterium]